MNLKNSVFGLSLLAFTFPVFAQNAENAPQGFVLAKAGSFLMGNASTPEADAAGGKPDPYPDEKPAHRVTITRSFYISEYEVTQKQWEEVMEDNPFYPKGDDLPVWNISWYDAILYCNRLSVKEGLVPCYTINKDEQDTENGAEEDSLKWIVVCDFSANGYRLPTEAEWEYAARGGSASEGFSFSGSENADEVGWHAGNSGGDARRVGQLMPNELGLFDMSGNVTEWCWDWYGEYTDAAVVDPTGPSSGSEKIRRGGRFNWGLSSLRVTSRDYTTPSAPPMLMEWLYGTGGLRPVRTVE